MSAHDDALDRYLDGLTRDSTIEPVGLDWSTDEAARLLYHLGSRPAPSPDFVERLGATLMERMERVPMSPLARPWGSSRAKAVPVLVAGRSAREGRLSRALAAIAVAAILVAASFAFSGRGPGEYGASVTGVAAPIGPDPDSEECRVSHETALTARPELDQRFEQILFRSVPAVLRPAPAPPHADQWVIPESTLPDGPDPDATTRQEITDAVRLDYACLDLARSGGTPAVRTGTAVGATPLPAPDILRMTALPDGRVGALLSSDPFGLGLGEYFIYAPYEAAWILIDSGQVAPDAWTASGYTGPTQHSVEIDIWDGLSLPAEAAIPAKRLITVTVVNHGSKPHRFAMEDFDVSVSLDPGEVMKPNIAATPGGHAYSVADVAVENPSAAGGYLWARDAGASTPAATP